MDEKSDKDSSFEIIQPSKVRKTTEKKGKGTRSADSDHGENVPRISCGKLFGNELTKLKPHWVSCDICTVWTCLSCLPEDFDLNKEYICEECLS